MQISSIPHIALRIKLRAKSAVCVLLSLLVVLSPAVSMANMMLHLPSDINAINVDVTYIDEANVVDIDQSMTDEMEMAEEGCHETGKQTSGHSESLIDLESGSECCESYCECSASGCSAQLGIIGAVQGPEFSSELFYSRGQGHYSSVSFSPQSPPPTL